MTKNPPGGILYRPRDHKSTIPNIYAASIISLINPFILKGSVSGERHLFSLVIALYSSSEGPR